MTETIGVIYAAIGEQYLHMAVASARSLKERCPSIAIDLFTDQPTDDPVFDQVHSLEEGLRFAKIPSMQRSRFNRTLFIDADTWIVADISDIFQILDRFDVAAAHDQYRNFSTTHQPLWTAIPNAFPQVNTGVLAFRKNAAVVELLEEWQKTVTDSGAERDQPAFRELLYLSDLRIATLPEEYNLMKYDVSARWTDEQSAPRIVHHRSSARWRTAESAELSSLTDIVGPKLSEHIKNLVQTDRSLSSTPSDHPLRPLNGYPVVRSSTNGHKEKVRSNFYYAVRAFMNQKR